MTADACAFRGARLITCGGKQPELCWRRWEAIEGSSQDYIRSIYENSKEKGKGKARQDEPRLRRLADPFLLALRTIREMRTRGDNDVDVRGGLFGRVQRGAGRMSLWVFELRDTVSGVSRLRDLEFAGLTEVGHSPSPICLNALFPCAPHGRTTCNTCIHPLILSESVTPSSYLTDLHSLRPAVDNRKLVAEAWAILTEAMIDTIAWEEGWLGERIAAELERREDVREIYRSPSSGRRERSPQLNLLPNGKLLLHTNPDCRTPVDSTIQEEFADAESPPEKGLFRLWPLRRNGWLLQSGNISQELQDQLVDDFEAVLGSSWSSGVPAGREVVWSTFWTNLSDLTVPLPGYEEGSPGMVTIWPHHLLAPPIGVQLSIRSPSNRKSSLAGLTGGLIQGAQPQEVPPRSAMTTDWLMEQAGSALSAWQEYITRPPEQPSPLTPPEDPPTTSEVTAAVQAEDTEKQEEMDVSDDDDLFGSSSSEANDMSETIGKNGESIQAGPIAHDSVEAASSTLMSPTFGGAEIRYVNPNPGPNPDAMVTEDDFDFFDAPADTPRLMNYDGMMDSGASGMPMSEEPYGEMYGQDMDGGFDLDKLLESQGRDSMDMSMSEQIDTYGPPAYDNSFCDSDLKFVFEDPGHQDVQESQLMDEPSPKAEMMESDLPVPAPPVQDVEPERSPTPPPLVVLSPEQMIRQRLSASLPMLLSPQPSEVGMSQVLRDMIPQRLWPVIHYSRMCRRRVDIWTSVQWGDGRVRDRRGLRSRLREQEEAKARTRQAITKASLSFWHPLDDCQYTTGLDIEAANSMEPPLDSPDLFPGWAESEGASSSASTPGHNVDSLHDVMSIGTNLFSDVTSTNMAFQCGVNLTSGQSDHLDRAYAGDVVEYVLDTPCRVVSGITDISTAAYLPWAAEAEAENSSAFDTPSSQALLSLATVWGNMDTKTLSHTLELPAILAGHDGNVIRLSASAIRHWPQLQLEPWGGKRDMILHWVYGNTAFEAEDVGVWQEAVDRAYRLCGLGKVTWYSHPVEDNQVTTIPDRDFLADTRQLASVIRIAPINLPPMPAYNRSTICCTPNDLRTPQAISKFVFALYHKHNHTRGAERSGNGGPAFVLAQRDSFARPIFTRTWPPPSSDVIRSKRFLHVVYAVRGDRLEMTCADGQGECVRTRTEILPKTAGQLQSVVRLVWKFAMDFASRASIEWRVNIMLSETSTVEEVEAWHPLLAAALVEVVRPVQFTLILLRAEDASLIALPFLPSLSHTLIQPPARQSIYLPSSEDDHDRLICPEASAYIITPPANSGSGMRHTKIESLHIILLGKSERYTVAYTRKECMRDLAQNLRDLRALSED